MSSNFRTISKDIHKLRERGKTTKITPKRRYSGSNINRLTITTEPNSNNKISSNRLSNSMKDGSVDSAKSDNRPKHLKRITLDEDLEPCQECGRPFWWHLQHLAYRNDNGHEFTHYVRKGKKRIGLHPAHLPPLESELYA